MVMDAVENMLRVLDKATFDEHAKTRAGTPNAFGYFTQIAWYAFVRRITKEKKEYHTKLKFIAESSLDDFMVDADEDPEVAKVVQSFIENLRSKIDDIKHKEEKTAEKKLAKKKATNRRKGRDSDLTEHFEE
jgi:methyl-accepting chemotaxis protein